MTDEIEQLVNVVCAANPLQEKYLKKFLPSLSQDEVNSLRRLIEFIRNVKGERYLEIGPGHGEYFVKALELSGLKFFRRSF